MHTEPIGIKSCVNRKVIKVSGTKTSTRTNNCSLSQHESFSVGSVTYAQIRQKKLYSCQRVPELAQRQRLKCV